MATLKTQAELVKIVKADYTNHCLREIILQCRNTWKDDKKLMPHKRLKFSDVKVEETSDGTLLSFTTTDQLNRSVKWCANVSYGDSPEPHHFKDYYEYQQRFNTEYELLLSIYKENGL